MHGPTAATTTAGEGGGAGRDLGGRSGAGRGSGGRGAGARKEAEHNNYQ